jgi:hypothetical protein
MKKLDYIGDSIVTPLLYLLLEQDINVLAERFFSLHMQDGVSSQSCQATVEVIWDWSTVNDEQHFILMLLNRWL